MSGIPGTPASDAVPSTGSEPVEAVAAGPVAAAGDTARPDISAVGADMPAVGAHMPAVGADVPPSVSPSVSPFGGAGIQGDGIIHEIQWSDALPWWLLFRAAGAAFSPTVIILAALGATALWAGWSLADQLGIPAVGPLGGYASAPVSVVRPLDGAAVLGALTGLLPAPATAAIGQALALFSPATTAGTFWGAVARLAWFLVVWSLFGTAIARVIGLHLAGEERIGLNGAVRFGSRLWTAPASAALFTLLGMLGLSLPGMLLGFLMRTDWGLAAMGAIWPLFLAGGFVLAILACGLVVGWPLMVAAVGVERGDSFQAISTAFSYLYQRPLHASFYTLVALIVAVPALALAALFADATAGLALWAASFGMGHDRTASLLAGGAGAETLFGGRAIQFWTRGLEAVLGSFGWGYFWAISTAAYMLLRRDVDGTELDEVVVDTTAD
jgi:hypothetical protein